AIEACGQGSDYKTDRQIHKDGPKDSCPKGGVIMVLVKVLVFFLNECGPDAEVVKHLHEPGKNGCHTHQTELFRKKNLGKYQTDDKAKALVHYHLDTRPEDTLSC